MVHIDASPLKAAAVLMLAAFAMSVAGVFLDPRAITGVPAWLKPAKFAISTAIFTATVAWMFRYIRVWPCFTRAMGWVLSIVLVLEVGIIDVQAARGVASHFNVSTALDGALFSVMGLAIGVLWLASVGVLAALFRQPFEDRAFGWSLRLGMLITVLGAASGGLMLRATPEQTRAARLHRPLAVHGGHTVGAPDGGPGMPGTNWSGLHGDLRIPHFFGLHGIQAIPLLGWLLRRAGQGTRLLFIAAAGYFGLIVILTWQALRGEPLLRPDGATLAALACLFALTGLAALSSWKFRSRAGAAA